MNANTERVRSVAFNDDGTLLASAGGYLSDTRVTIWSAGGALLKTLTNAVVPVESVVFSPDGKFLVGTGGIQGVLPDSHGYSLINLWDTTEWNWRGITNNVTLPPVIQLAFSHSGKYLGAAGGNTYGDLAIFEMPSGSLVTRYGQNIYGYGSLAFSADDRELASSLFGALSTQIRNATNGTVRIELPVMGSVAYSPDGTTLMIAEDRLEPPGPADQSIFLANAATGTIRTNLPHRGTVCTAAFTPDAKAIVSWAGDDKIRFWSLRDYSVFQVYDEETTDVWALAVAPNGRYFAYGRDDGVVVLAQMPVWITDIAKIGNEVRLTWSGGSGLYQVQRTSDLASGLWDNIGDVTTETSATVGATSAFEFFRVQSLPNP